VRDWEAAAEPASAAGIRVAHPRSGLVLARGGGMLARLLPLARFGTCPRFGTGNQIMSWISLTDEVAALDWLLSHPEVSGPVNLTAPDPVGNAEFAATVNTVLHRPDLDWARIPAWLIRIAVGEAAVELLTSAHVRARRLTESGYVFRHPTLREALAAELAR
jgi:uncharacterized protein (TIGR01777 family)